MSDESVGGISVNLTADNSELVKGVEEAISKVTELGEVAEALGLAEIFEKWSEYAVDVTKEFDQQQLALERVAVATSGLQTEKFSELAEQLSKVSGYSEVVSLNAVSMLGKFNLTDQQIAALLPKLQDFASFTGNDLSSAAQAFGTAIASGEVSTRRLGLAMDEQEKTSFKFADTQGRVNSLLGQLSRFEGMAGQEAATATGQHKVFENQMEALHESIGALLEQPVAQFWTVAANAVQLVTQTINSLNPEVKTAIGNIVTIAGGMATFGLAATAAWKAFGVVETVLVTVKEFAILSAAIAAPWLAAAAAIAAVGAAAVTLEGVLAHGITASTAGGIVNGIKQGFTAGLNDVSGLFKEKLGALTSGLFVTPKVEGGEGEESGFANLGGGRAGANPMFADLLKNDNPADFDMTLDFAHFDKGVSDATVAVEKMDQELKQSDIGKTLGAALSQWDEDLQGMSKEQIAGLNAVASLRISVEQKIIAGLQTVGESLLSQLGGVGAGIKAALSGNVADGVMSVVLDLLNRSAGFKEIMTDIGQLMTNLAAVLDPLMETVKPLINALVNSVGGVITTLLPVLTTILAPLTEVFRSLGELLYPILTIVGDVATVFLKLDPVITVLDVVLRGVADVIKGVATGLATVINFIIGIWDSLIDGLADILSEIPVIGDKLKGWVEGAHIDTISLDNMAAATDQTTDTVTDLNNQLAIASENLPEGFTIARDAYEALTITGGTSAPAAAAPAQVAAATSAAQQASTSVLKNIGSPTIAATAQVTVDQALKDVQSAVTKQETGNGVSLLQATADASKAAADAQAQGTAAYQAAYKQAVSAGQSAMQAYATAQAAEATAIEAIANKATSAAGQNKIATSTSTSTVNIQSVQVQASTPDLIKQIQSALNKQGYLQTGTSGSTAAARMLGAVGT